VFDLLTFIGFIDCLYDFSKKQPNQTIFTMQFEYSLNILLGRDIHSPFLIDDIIELRSKVLSNFDDWNKEYLKRKDKPLQEVAKILSESIPPNKEFGTPRSASSFEYSEDSNVSDSSPSASASPGSSSKHRHKRTLTGPIVRRHKRRTSRSSSASASPGSSSRGGRKPITKKIRRVNRKIRVSRRKY
jgi:hypothetical protein